MSCSTITPIRKILIECHPDILSRFDIPLSHIINLNSKKYLRIFLLPEEYTRIVEGEKTAYQDSYKTPYVHPKVVRVGFTAQITDDDWRVRACLEYLAKSSISTGYKNYIPITIIDFVRPEVEDYKKDSDSYTVRKGLLSVDEGGGTSGENNSAYGNGGFAIKFTEVNKRLVI